MEKDDAAISTILVVPKNQFYFSYRINEGVSHVIKKEKAFKYFKTFISQKNYTDLSNYLSKFLPILILVDEDKIVELKKEDSENNQYHHMKLENEMKSVGSRNRKVNREKEFISNDKKLQNLFKKMVN